MVKSASGSKHFGKYVIESKIGIGGMAEVYRARLANNEGSVFAIKKILSHYSRDENLISMLVNEAKVSVSLRHPNIVPIYDFGRVGDSYYIAMEFVRGKNLKDIVQECRRRGMWISPKLALFIMMEVLEALAYAHNRRDNFNQPLEIVHRDVSPQNIMISESGSVKILDFGIAKVRGKAAETQTGILKGKFGYMSPEQAKGKRVDARTDIFSAGILLYEMLTLENPFLADTELETLRNVKRAKYVNPRLLNKTIPKSIEKIISKALKKNRLGRYRTTEAFQRHIYKVQSNEVGFGGATELCNFIMALFQTETTPPKKFTLEERIPEVSDVKLIEKGGVKRAVVVVSLLIVIVICWSYRSHLSVMTRNVLLTARNWFRGFTASPRPLDSLGGQPERVQRRTSTRPFLQENPRVIFEGEAQAQLGRLPFEQFETLRNDVADKLIAYLKDRLDTKPYPYGRTQQAEIPGYHLTYRVFHQGEVIAVSAIHEK